MNFLPLNRKEKFWTGTVLPQIICGPRFVNLSAFLRMAKVPERFIKLEYNNDIQFETEYCLRDSAINDDSASKISGITPDLTIVLENQGEHFLIFIEAKVFQKVTANKVRGQLNRQKKIANKIMQKPQFREGNFCHVFLCLEKPVDFVPNKDEIMINWKDVAELYKNEESNYFYKQLVLACNSSELMSEGVNSFRKNSTGSLNSVGILHHFNEFGDFYVGRAGNLRQVEKDCQNGEITARWYEVNTACSIDKPPGVRGTNWFKASDFIKLLEKYEKIPAQIK